MLWLLDPNKLFPLLVGFWCLLGLAQAARRVGDVRQRRMALDVGLAASTALLLTVGGYLFVPDGAGIVAASAWGTLVIGPNVTSRIISRRASRRDFRTAAMLCRVLAVVRPLGHWRDFAHLLRALRWLAEGQRNAGLGLLARLEHSRSELADEAQLERLVAEQRWDELYANFHARQQSGTLILGWLPRFLRAMGETNRPDELLRTAILQSGPLFANPAVLPQALLVTFAFTGRPELVRELIAQSLGYLDATSREAWIATAQMAGGDLASGRDRLQNCRPTAVALQLPAIDRRLAVAPALADAALPLGGRRQVQALVERWKLVQRFVPGHGAQSLPWATALIAGAICIVFGLEEVLGGSTNPATLELVGALMTDRVLDGEWWRVFSAVFIHMGLLHLLMNGMGLIALGTFVERRLGAWRVAVLFLVSGALPMATHVALAALGDAQTSVGASGGVMGLAGATAALLAQGYFDHGVIEAHRPLRLIVTLVVLQTGIDLTVPIVDFLGHSMGLATGFTLGALFCGLRWWRIVLFGAPAYAFALGMQLTLQDLPWRTVPCSEGETAMCQQLCDMEFYDACHEVGVKYLSGEDVDEDIARARTYFASACEGKVGRSCAVLGQLVYHGEGGPQDRAAGAELVWKGCQLHAEKACELLDDLCQKESDLIPCSHRERLAR